MLGEYKVNRCTRQCHALGRALRDGEWYYSVLFESADEFVRKDYSAESWQGPPEGAIGWWKNRMPSADEKKLVLAPPEVLIELLRQMGEVPGKEKSRYLLALMLMRRRIVRLAPAEDRDDSAEQLRVQVPADGSVIAIPTCVIGKTESETLREELNALLYCEAEES